MSQIIYVLTNPVMPNLVKIGKTTNLVERVRSLSAHSGVPIPFEVNHACTVQDSNAVEKGLMDAFGDHRINSRREFFRINPERVIAILKLLALEEVTPSGDIVEDQEEQITLNNERKRRSGFRFSSADVPAGAILTFIRDKNIEAVVLDDDRSIEFEGEKTSLSRSALKVINRDFGKNWTTTTGPDLWEYENESLSERRMRLETED